MYKLLFGWRSVGVAKNHTEWGKMWAVKLAEA